LGKWHGPKKNLCGTNSFWHAMAHTKACHGTHQGPGANLGFEAWATFQMSYNELRNTLWANGTGQKKICAAPTRFGMPWHTPRHAMAHTKAPEPTLDLKLGTPSKCLIMNLGTHFGQMARAKKKFVRHQLVLACHGTHQDTHQGPGANLGFEAWDTFQMSYNELRNTLWANGTGQKKICAAPTRFGMPWHTPRHAMAPTKATEPTLDLKLGTPSKCLIMNLGTHFGQMAWAKKKFVRHQFVLACHGTHQGMPWHPPRPRRQPWI
jgi:hypothetical protein